MNFLGGGEHHSASTYRRQTARSSSGSPDSAAPGDLFQVGRPGDVRGFIHKSFIGKAVGGVVSKVIGGVPLVGGVASGIFDRLRGANGAVPQVTGCPPGFINTGTGCVPRGGGGLLGGIRARIAARPVGAGLGGFLPQDGAFVPPTAGQTAIRTEMGLAVDPAAGVPVMGRFGAGFEPSVFMTDTRRCGRGAVLGVDGICYNKRDLRNNERFWPRGRRPLLTGGEMRAISTASSAAKKLQRKQKQLESLGLLKRPAARSRRALPAGHRAELRHAGSGHE